MSTIEILKNRIVRIKNKICDFIRRKLENIPENAIIDLHRVYLRK